jgi:hypothetical protein
VSYNNYDARARSSGSHPLLASAGENDGTMRNRRGKASDHTTSTAITFDTVREIARGFPGAVEGLSYGTPAFRVGKSLFVRLHQDGDALVVKIDPQERAMRMKADRRTFYITDHYLKYPWVLVRLATVEREDLRELLEDAWKQSATARAIVAYQRGKENAETEQSQKPRRKR